MFWLCLKLFRVLNSNLMSRYFCFIRVNWTLISIKICVYYLFYAILIEFLNCMIGSNVEISPKTLQMYDNLNENHSNNSSLLEVNKTKTDVNHTTSSDHNSCNRQSTMASHVSNQKKRPLSISSVSSSSSSSCSSLTRNGSLGMLSFIYYYFKSDNTSKPLIICHSYHISA